MHDALLTQPAVTEFPAYYGVYLGRLPARPLDEALAMQSGELRAMLEPVSPERFRFRYAAGKWSISELVGHLIDCERIFSTRALCIARGEEQPMPGFDENAYVEHARFDDRSPASLLDEFAAVRTSTIALYASLGYDGLLRTGTANNGTFTPRAIAWILVGHTEHHLRVLSERYAVARTL